MKSQKSFPLAKEEVMHLLQLIEENPILYSKATNAPSNRLKEATWANVTDHFNAAIACPPRTTEQLRYKWDNLKKAARKRNTAITNLKTGRGKPEFIPPDDILDRVAAILSSASDGCTVPFDGDGTDDPLGDTGEDSSSSTVVNIEVLPLAAEYDSTPSGSAPAEKGVLSSSMQTPKFYFSSMTSKEKLKRLAISDEMKASVRDRNKAIADYYKAKNKREEDYFALKKRKLELEILQAEEKIKRNIIMYNSFYFF